MTPGDIYQFRGIIGPKDADGKQRWIHPPGLYRFLGIALDYRTRQQKVVYTGVGGRDDGLMFIAVLSDWARDFTLIEDLVPG